MWVGLIQSVEGLKRKTDLPEQERILPAVGMWVETTYYPESPDWWASLQISDLIATIKLIPETVSRGFFLMSYLTKPKNETTDQKI